MIIFRYLFKEVFSSLAVVTAVLLLVFLSHQFVRYLGDAAAGKLDITVVLRLMTLEIPHLMGLLLPLGLFLGILLAYGRLYVDGEMTVLAASGIGPARLLGMTLSISIVVTLIVAAISLWLSPLVAADKNRILAQANSASALQTLLPGRFKELANGQKIIYVENMSYDRQRMHNVFVAEQVPASGNAAMERWTVLSAKDGYQYLDDKTKDLFFVATDGHRYEGVPGKNDYHLVKFAKYGVRLQSQPLLVNNNDEEVMSTSELLAAGTQKIREAAELQWRISMPLMTLLLTLLAVPLSQVKPRQGKYAQMFPSMLIFIVYANLLFVGRAWLESGAVSIVFGVWWVHALVLILGIILLLRYIGWRYFLTSLRLIGR